MLLRGPSDRGNRVKEVPGRDELPIVDSAALVDAKSLASASCCLRPAIDFIKMGTTAKVGHEFSSATTLYYHFASV